MAINNNTYAKNTKTGMFWLMLVVQVYRCTGVQGLSYHFCPYFQNQRRLSAITKINEYETSPKK